MKSVIQQSGDMPHYCNICGEKIGSINQEAGIFDARYGANYQNHTCEEWHPLNKEMK